MISTASGTAWKSLASLTVCVGAALFKPFSTDNGGHTRERALISPDPDVGKSMIRAEKLGMDLDVHSIGGKPKLNELAGWPKESGKTHIV